MAHDHDHDHKLGGAGYEVEDASVREVLATGIVLAIGTIVVCFAVAGLMKVFTATDSAGSTRMTQLPAVQTLPPGPRLQEKPWEELRALRQNEEQSLSTYGWVNKAAGTVRIPIDQAMSAVVPQLPSRAATGSEGSGRPKTGRSEGNVPSQAIGFPVKGAGAKANAREK